MKTAPNNFVLIGGIVIIGIGWVNAASQNKPVSKVIMGGVSFIVIASLLDLAGGYAAKFANGMVALALVTTIIVEGGTLFNTINSIGQGKPTKKTG
jgi:hypothetical protein